MSEQLLEAGAILAGAPAGGADDAMTARSYRHPVLDGRTVVRLVGATVGPAEDLTMDFLGFEPAAAPAPVGHARRQALGFPAWALVHDPANGRHALALVKEMEKLARVARSKPGNAKDGYDALAGRLGAAAPAFLPTFWEQAGRAFLGADNQRMAGTCFTEARRAEQVHGLAVDEDRVRDVHLEFAFAGALTAAMLAEYARGVVVRRPATEAYALVRTLALRRVAGGLPPHASMAADLARLAKAAGLDPEQEADAIVPQLLGYPAMGRAHPSVWKAYRKSLVRTGRRDPEVRARLLAIVPEPPGWRTDMTAQWLEIIEASGAAADLIAGSGPGADPATPARWLGRILAGRRSSRTSGERSEALLGLVERMLPRLAAGPAVPLADSLWRVELDVLDLCLSAGVPIEIGDRVRRAGFDVAEWAEDKSPGRRDLAAVAADPQWRPVLREGARHAVRRLRNGDSLTSPALPEQTLRHAFGAAGVREVLVDLVTELAGQAGDGTLRRLDLDLTELAPLWSPHGMALAPDAFRRLAAVDVAAVVTRSLRAGLPEELGWGAYEEAARQVKAIRIGESWPELVVHGADAAYVIAPDGAVTEHQFRFPTGSHPHAPVRWSETACRLVDGDLLVMWRGEEGGVGYWSSRPSDLIAADMLSEPVLWQAPAEPLPVPGGGLTTGARPVHPGDPRGPGASYPLASDGQAFWRCEYVRSPSGPAQWQWREFDPRTGAGGRVSVPAFFSDFSPGAGRLDAIASRLRPVPAVFAGSPLGASPDLLAGWRTVVTDDGTQSGEGADGRRVVLPAGAGGSLVGALMLPGAETPLPITHEGGYRNGSLTIWTADGRHPLAVLSPVNSLLPPLAWWHALRPRDEAGSAALRSLAEPVASALLAVDAGVTKTLEVRDAVTANLETHLPGVTDPVLRARLAEVLARAVRLNRRLTEIAAHLEAEPETAPELAGISDEALTEAWKGLEQTSRSYYMGSTGLRHEIMEQIRVVAAHLAGDAGAPPVPAVASGWASLLGGLGAAAVRAASPVVGDADREALVAFLTTVAGTPLTGEGIPVRVAVVTQKRTGSQQAEIHRDGGQVSVLFPPENYHWRDDQVWDRVAVQGSASGVFTPPPGTTVGAETYPSGRMTTARLERFAELLAARGPAPWRPEAAETLAGQTGMTRAEAILLLAGLPGINDWHDNFLTTEQRTVLGLSAAHAKVGRETLRDLTPAQRVALLDAAMPADPAALWETGPDVAAVAAEWIRIRGRRIAVPETLVTDLARFVERIRPVALLQAIADPRPGDWLSTDGRTEMTHYNHLTTTVAQGTAFSQDHLKAAATTLPWLAYRLSWDDPLRLQLPGALRLVRERLRNPHLLVGWAMFEVKNRPDGMPALVERETHNDWMFLHLAPAKLTGPDDPAILYTDDDTRAALKILLSDWIDAAVATPPQATGDPHDPRVAAPVLVGEVAGRFGLDADAAAYYLQLLALPDPTDRNVQAWNGWKPAQLRRAREALLAAELVVAAKRERAGRPIFLPGGWFPARAPMLPVETWKAEMYQHAVNQRLVTRSLPDQFAMAWSRVTGGDIPRYSTLEEKP
ncbi:DNA-binding protein [Actinoplanes sp. OR16]|uniref:hypothetical protein n=1 Tax=Actinoplanes sp. OR16 TaxID=946334 RepID=UPI000F6B640E|nr:hypothetical protein [Actinoplanes sp. OR16]BBH67606.1 DNA-binding protein [Actinoplanes sp. OR16]